MKSTLLGSLKGGAGKSSVILNLADSAARTLGMRVLVIDSDPQATASDTFGVDEHDGLPTLADAYALWRQGQQVDLTDLVVERPGRWACSLIPADLRLVAVEGSRAPGDEFMLAEMLSSLRDAFDWVLLDQSASVGVLSTNLLHAADHAMLVVRPDRATLSASAVWLEAISAVVRTPPTNFVTGAVVTGFVQRRREPRRRIEELETWAPNAGIMHPYGGVHGAPVQLLEPYLTERAVFNATFGAGIPVHLGPASHARRQAEAEIDALAAALWTHTEQIEGKHS